MSDPISTALASFNLLKDGLTYLRNVDEKWNVAEIRNKAADLLNELADLKFTLSDTKEVLAKKDQTIKELEDALTLKRKLIKHYDAYYEIDENGKPIGDAYCLRCYEAPPHKAYHVAFDSSGKQKSNGWICPHCKSWYSFPTAKRIEPDKK